MNEDLRKGCAKIFREVSGLSNSKIHFGWTDEKLLTEPLESLGVDSLTLLDFVMKVEDTYHVQLDEEAVNLCEKVEDLIVLVAVARNGTY